MKLHHLTKMLIVTALIAGFSSVAWAEKKVPTADHIETMHLGTLPILFEPNHGQSDDSVLFMTRGLNRMLYLTARGTVVTVAVPDDKKVVAAALKTTWPGSNPNSKVVAEGLRKSTVNHYQGNKKEDWHLNLSTYARVRYEDIYPGIDLVYHGSGNALQYDWHVSPGANPEQIRLKFDGAEYYDLDKSGNLIIGTKAAAIVHSRPRVYQLIGNKQQAVKSSFTQVGNNLFGFKLGKYDSRYPLLIDPQITFETLLGGSNKEGLGGDPNRRGVALSADQTQNIFVASTTISVDFPTSDNSSLSMGCAYFVARLLDQPNPQFLYTTIITSTSESVPTSGCSSNELEIDIDHDGAGGAVLAGNTFTPDFPIISNTYQPEFGGPPDGARGFVARINPDGHLFRSTYFGNFGNHLIKGISVDWQGGDGYLPGIYIAGDANLILNQDDLIPHQQSIRSHMGQTDAFVGKLSMNLEELEYYTYIGSSGYEIVRDIAVFNGQAIVIGRTSPFFTPPHDFPVTVDALQTSFGGGDADVFITKLSANGENFVYSTLWGEEGIDIATAVGVDSSGLVTVVGFIDMYNPSLSRTGFVATLSFEGDRLINLARFPYLIEFHDVAVHPDGQIHIIGTTNEEGLATSNAIRTTRSGNYSPIYMILDSAPEPVYSTYINGGIGDAIALTSLNCIYLAGSKMNMTNRDIFITRLCDVGNVSVTKNAPNEVEEGEQFDYRIDILNQDDVDIEQLNVTDVLPDNLSFISALPPDYEMDGQEISFDLGTLDAGGFSSIRITVSADRAGEVCNTARVSAINLIPTDAEACTDVSEPPLLLPQVSVTKIGPETVEYNSTLEFIVIVQNTGSVPLQNVTFHDAVNFKKAIILTEVSTDSGHMCQITANQDAECSLDSLDPGDEVRIQIQAESRDIAGSVVNTASVTHSFDTNDPTSDQHTIIVNPIEADLSLELLDRTLAGGVQVFRLRVSRVDSGDVQIPWAQLSMIIQIAPDAPVEDIQRITAFIEGVEDGLSPFETRDGDLKIVFNLIGDTAVPVDVVLRIPESVSVNRIHTLLDAPINDPQPGNNQMTWTP